MEVTNRFKGLDLVDRVPEELWTEVHNIIQEVVTKTIPKEKKNARRQSGCLKKLYKYLRKEEKRKQEIKGKTYQLNAEFQRIARRAKKTFLNE